MLVGLLTGWNYLSDVISEVAHIETESFSSPWKFPVIALGTLITCGGIVGLGSVLWGRRSLRELGWTLASPGRLVLVGVLQAALIILLVIGVYGAMGGLRGIEGLFASMASLSIGQRVFFTLMGIKIAFLEESLFRGDLGHSLARGVSPIVAMVISSAVFALFHRTLAPVPLAMKFLMGLMFALSTHRTGSLVPGALAHALVWAIVANN